MPTEEKTLDVTQQPELIAAAGRYYIMDRRTKKQDEPQDGQKAPIEADAPISSLHKKRRREIPSSVGYLLAGIVGAVTGALIAVLYPLEGVQLISANGFPDALTDRLLRCGAFLLAEYLLGYFAAGGLLTWVLPLVYGLGAGLSAAEAVMSGALLLLLPYSVCTLVICLAAARSAEFSSLLLSVVSGKSGSVITDGTAGSSYTMRFGAYLMALSAAALAEAWILTI